MEVVIKYSMLLRHLLVIVDILKTADRGGKIGELKLTFAFLECGFKAEA